MTRSPPLFSIRNHPLFSSQPLLPCPLPPSSPFPASPRIGAPRWFSLQGRTWRRGEESTQSPDEALRRGWEGGRAVTPRARTHSEGIWKMRVTQIYIRFVPRFKVSCPPYQTFKEKRIKKKKEKTQQWINHTATENLYCSTVSWRESERERDKDAERERDSKEKLKEKAGKERTPLWSFDGALLWNMVFLDSLLNPSSVRLIIRRKCRCEAIDHIRQAPSPVSTQITGAKQWESLLTNFKTLIQRATFFFIAITSEINITFDSAGPLVSGWNTARWKWDCFFCLYSRNV